MNNQDIKEEFDKISKKICKIREECSDLYQFLEYKMDKKGMEAITADLTWVCENLTVLGLHQIGKALDDNMGTGINPKDK